MKRRRNHQFINTRRKNDEVYQLKKVLRVVFIITFAILVIAGSYNLLINNDTLATKMFLVGGIIVAINFLMLRLM